MVFDYDSLYRDTPDALGAPGKALVDFFAARAASGLRVLDVGCGQGRDALFIARLGHRVLGVDLSAHGIAALTRAAKAEALPVEAMVADVATFEPAGSFDVILFDRVLHMLDEAPRLAALRRLAGHVAPGGWLLIEDEPSNIAGFKTVIAALAGEWATEKARGGALLLRRTP